MATKKKFSTQVYQMPTDPSASRYFLDGVKALAKECKAKWVSGSVHDEISYVESLETELKQHIGDFGVENIRHEFERKSTLGNG